VDAVLGHGRRDLLETGRRRAGDDAFVHDLSDGGPVQERGGEHATTVAQNLASGIGVLAPSDPGFPRIAYGQNGA